MNSCVPKSNSWTTSIQVSMAGLSTPRILRFQTSAGTWQHQAGSQNQQYLRGTVKGYCKNQRSCSHLHLRERPVSPSPLSKAPAAPAYTQNYQALLSTYYHYNMLITQAVQPQWMLVARDNKGLATQLRTGEGFILLRVPLSLNEEVSGLQQQLQIT